MPVVSVVIPAYNSSSYIVRALRSVLSQDWHGSMEVIVVDDGSEDETFHLVQKMAENESRVRCIRKRENEGPAEARNLGVREARGRFIAFLDADDFWFPHHLSTQLKLFEKDDGIALVHGRYIDDYGGKRVEGKNFRPLRGRLRGKTLLTFKACINTVVVNREMFIDAGMFNGEFSVGEDFEAWRRVAALYPIDYTDSRPVAVYNHRDRSRKRDRQLLRYEMRLKALEDIYRRFKRSNSVTERAYKRVKASLLLRYSKRLLHSGRRVEARQKAIEALCIRPSFTGLQRYLESLFSDPLR